MSTYDQQLFAFTAALQDADPDRAEVAIELEALQSIYGENSVRPWSATRRNADQDDSRPPSPSVADSLLGWLPGDRIRFEVLTTLTAPHEAVQIRLLVTLPSAYPASSPPQLQLLSRYIGDFGVDAALFGAIMRTYIAHPGVEWNPGDVAVFDGIEHVKGVLGEWYNERLSLSLARHLEHEQEHEAALQKHKSDAENVLEASSEVAEAASPQVDLPSDIKLFESEPIMDRKSVFVARACTITDPAQVPLIIQHLLSDRKIARAAHPVIRAWRVQVNGILHQDNDDDGETAAGGRLAHLLQILGLTNVLVVVTRYFGGIHLGPDRFKHINAAARNAIEAAGLLDDQTKKPKGNKRK
ncbi:eIF2 kinase Gcn2p negative regulator [Tulasnella sp. UAMH 9824]|nr:eIF2 kinase Gcn2p negative regulator [Tulasnella sp. UAMH 9824]